jgi:predicted outer membrane protein
VRFEAQALFTSISIAAASNFTTQNLQTLVQETRTMLANTAPGPAFDRAFLQNQLQMHQMVLGMIDTMLLPSAHSQQFKTAPAGRLLWLRWFSHNLLIPSSQISALPVVLSFPN